MKLAPLPVAVLLLLPPAARAADPLPPPNHPILFGYYFVDNYYGDFTHTTDVWDYTNLSIAIPCAYRDASGSSLPGDCGPHEQFRQSLRNAGANGREIYLTMSAESTWNWTLEYAREVWDRVKLVEALHERDLSRDDTNAVVSRLKALMDAKGLPRKPVGALYSRQQVLATDGLNAPSLDFVGFENYWKPSECGGREGCVNAAYSLLDRAKPLIPASKKIVLVTMAFDRAVGDGDDWKSDPGALVALQDPNYFRAYNDPRVAAILMFAYSRGEGVQGGSDKYPGVLARHREQGAQLLRAMNIDAPASGTVRQPFNVGGWAVDLAARGGPGVDTVHVWAWPASGGPASFLGAAAMAPGTRPDVGAYFFGDSRFSDAGFNVSATGLGAGSWTIAAYAHSTVANNFTHARTVTVSVPAPAMTIDIPSPGAVPSTFTVGGWAVDPAAASGTGVSTVHVWAVARGGAATFLGANYGVLRPDVGAAFGSPRFAPSGFNVTASLPPGEYTIAASALSTVTNTFSNQAVVGIVVR